jgi:UDP-N-acetylglucosamine 4,6-dehydratase/5-epimerase
MKSILVTGGTGSFGKALLAKLVRKSDEYSRIVIYSRDELKQWEMQNVYPSDKYPQLRFFLGDIRDKERLTQALNGIDSVIHAAALKQVPAAEYNPIEFVKTNVLGAENLIHACLATSVSNVIALSTDKAASPINLYGATKLCSDKLFIAANNIRGSNSIRFSVVRYGNVMGSRGSVIPFFMEKAPSGTISITDNRMTRFNITLEESVQMVLWALSMQNGGELFVPKIPSYRITDVAEAIAPSCSRNLIGIRPGEKLHEEMITASDSLTTVDLGSYYSILPAQTDISQYQCDNVSRMEPGFSYSSDKNSSFLTVAEIRHLIKANVSSEFKPI